MINIIGNNRGSVTILFSVVLLYLLALIGLCIDVGYVYTQKAKMQNSVDAAVIAGAYELPITAKARVQAKKYLTVNGMDADKASFKFDNTNNRIKLTYSTKIETFFLRMLGFKIVEVGVVAAAERQTGVCGEVVVLVQ
jgi:Flp pilus assembly protein TadG